MQNVDKSMQPMGPLNDDDDLDVSVADDGPSNVTHHEDGSVEVDLSGGMMDAQQSKDELDHDGNLAEVMDPGVLSGLANDLMTDVADDLSSRSDWEKAYKDGLKLLGLKIEERTEPWDGACGVVHPLLTEAIVRFQAEMVSETFPAGGPVKTKIKGAIDKLKEEAAERVRNDMNIEVTDNMPEYRSEHERLLWNLPACGSAFKKVYFDSTLGRQAAMFVNAEDFIAAYGASDLASCPRYTHVIKKTPNDLKKLQVAGFYRDIELGDPTIEHNEIHDQKDKIQGTVSVGEAEYHTLYEISVDLDLDGFEDPLGIALPYVVTIDKDSREVLSIRRNYDEHDEQRKKILSFVHYQYIPGFGFYGFGLIHLVGGFAQSATSLLRQLVDAGTLSNLPGGLKTRGMRIKGDDTPIGPGEFRDVDVPGGTLQENLMLLPYKEPSQVLAALLQSIVDEGRKLAAVAEMQIQDFDSNSPVGTTMALLERTLKVMSSIQSRVYEAMKLEFRLIKNIIAEYGADTYTYDPETGDKTMRKADYQLTDVMPVADPNAATMSQRIVQWQAVMQLAAMAPQIYDLPQLHARMLAILNVKDIGKLIPTLEDNQVQMDPVSENMAIMNMKPVKAFMEQDHKSHIAVHQAAMQDPKITAMMGQNPQAPLIQGAAMAHLMEHMAFAYRSQIEQMMGTPLPPPDKPLPPDVEVQLSALIAQAAQKALGINQNEAAQQAQQQAAQDPVLQQQMAQTKVQQDEVDRKKTKDANDLQIARDRLLLEKQKLQADTTMKAVDKATAIHQHNDQMGQQQSQQQAQLGHQQDVAATGHIITTAHKVMDHAHAAQQANLDRQNQLQIEQEKTDQAAHDASVAQTKKPAGGK